jgi:hypothetical protein
MEIQFAQRHVFRQIAPQEGSMREAEDVVRGSLVHILGKLGRLSRWAYFIALTRLVGAESFGLYTLAGDRAALARNGREVHPPLRRIPGGRMRGHPYDPEIEDWLKAILENGRPRCDLFDGAGSTAATLVAARAIEEGRTLPVPAYRRIGSASRAVSA